MMPSRPRATSRGRSLRAGASCVALMIAASAGCAGPQKPVFPEMKEPVVWPKAPDSPRIRYIGELTGEESLHAPRKGMQALGEFFSGPQPKLAFSTPMAVIARGDVVYVADGQAGCVYRMDLAAKSFSSIRDAAGKRLEWPIDLAHVNEQVAVADSKRGAVFLFNGAGAYQRSIGLGELKRPSAIAYDAAAGELWVIDSGAHDCKVFDAGGAKKRVIGMRGSASGQFNFPTGVALTPPTTQPARGAGVVIADSMNFRVQIVGAEGTPMASFGRKGDAAGDFALPRDVAADSEGHLYVLDNQFENVQIFDGEGRLLMAFGQEGRGPGEFYLPSGIHIDERDRIWIADTYNRRVQVFQYLRDAQP